MDLLNIIILFAFAFIQKADKEFIGTVISNNKIIAEYQVIKSMNNDSLVWSYNLKHKTDSTLYEVKYKLNKGIKEVCWDSSVFLVFDSIVCKNETVYVFDLYNSEIQLNEGYIFISNNYGLVSVYDNYEPEFLEIDGAPKLQNCITDFIERF